ncbi:folate-binding protein YgfZ [Maritimibacter sp. DP1N21-5]|uniref:CAF17-like 4Fe-4S cluster assembly/insertion protein YgfZ n=1 Tax=Maritimibacter sp. DP1N21-5 TaxID=2836867 RepID=UPI001C453FA1|nr:folate-binding protein [Maritimibacter sp. DP1N21-5]MBV7410356.1 folate-binding protein [Maritimibacter sp. DP1N21-5]
MQATSATTGEVHKDRTVLRLTGADRIDFLEGLVTNHVTATEGLVYAALLTPQGKYIADFFILTRKDDVLLDVDTSLAHMAAQRLGIYRLRKDVTIEATDMIVLRGLDEAPDGALPDPRDPALGWRAYRDAGSVTDDAPDNAIDWDAIRVAQTIPETGQELTPETYILEAGFERLHGVDFRKGCYVGQEVTARMKHKTELRKGFVTVELAGTAEPGADIVNEDGKVAGTLHTVAGEKAIAYLRFDWAKGPMTAGEATVTWKPA